MVVESRPPDTTATTLRSVAFASTTPRVCTVECPGPPVRPAAQDYDTIRRPYETSSANPTSKASTCGLPAPMTAAAAARMVEPASADASISDFVVHTVTDMLFPVEAFEVGFAE